MQVKDRPAPLVQLKHRRYAGQEGLRKVLHSIKIFLRIDKNMLDVAGHQVPQNPQRQRQVFVYQCFYQTLAAPLLNDTPEFDEKIEIGTQ